MAGQRAGAGDGRRDRGVRLLEVADIGPPSSQESIVRASRCNRTNQGSLWASGYGSSRDSYAYYHGNRRECATQPMLMGRELRTVALLAGGSVELTPFASFSSQSTKP